MSNDGGKGEAVAWLVTGGHMFVDRVFISRKAAENSVAERKDGAIVEPLYTDPRALTDDEIKEIWSEYVFDYGRVDFLGFARAILSADKDKP